MKRLFALIICVLTITWTISLSAQSPQGQDSPPAAEAYYFHYSSRCVTCKAVEAEAKADLENLYGKSVTFTSVNLEDPSGKDLAEKLRVKGQTLIVIRGTKSINLTNEGFLYARSDPEKFKQIIKEKVDPLIY